MVNQEKSRIVAANGNERSGFIFRGKRVKIHVADKSIQCFKRRVREITGRSRGISMERRLGGPRSYLRGWIGYFGLAAEDTAPVCSPVQPLANVWKPYPPA